MPPGISIPLLVAYVWALIRSARRWETFWYMAGSWAIAVGLFVIVAGVMSATGNMSMELMFARFWGPTGLVPAIVGVIHARKYRRGASDQGGSGDGSYLDARPKKGIVYTKSELEAMKVRESGKEEAR
jgi:hypothetical protein